QAGDRRRSHASRDRDTGGPHDRAGPRRLRSFSGPLCAGRSRARPAAARGMTAIVFVGPTLRPEEIAGAGDFIALPPVSQGDVYRAALRRPRAIGIIDGYFSGAASVWHKEILWAMSEGVPLFGAASMGALRAAELHEFGMRGIGRIFESFRDGVLEDDDEVAVVHGPVELDYLAASEAMVNIRATLARAETVGILSKSSRSALEAFGKSMFFPQRSW